MGEFEKLFQPGRIGKLDLKNRIIFPPMVTRYVSGEGGVSDQMLNYYGERSRGGCGLILIESSYPRSGGYPGRIYVDNDEVISGLRRLVEVIHDGGARAGIQINPHRGRSDEVDPASASETIHPKTGIKARALSIADIKKLVDEFGEGARRAKEAGFDCIMIHGGSGYIVSEFLSPRTNKRLDEYGGDTTKRARFALELVAAVREKTGPHYPIIFRLTADEKIEGGFGIKDAITVSKLLEEAGVDAIDIVSGVNETFYWVIPSMYLPQGCNTDLSQAVRKAVKIPVLVAGNINDPYVAEEILREEKADFVDLGRPLIADPQFPNKTREGKIADICKCLRCCRCIESILKQPVGPMICTVNPAVGREKEFESRLKSVSTKKKVVVIGGGPGGMEAAMMAGIRGHDVTLWEGESKLGGQLNIAAIPPYKDELNRLNEYLRIQLDKLKVKLMVGREMTKEMVLELSPDAVILATGSKPIIPNIKGMERKNVFVNRDVLSGAVDVGKKTIVVGGGFVGCETAEFLTEKGKNVTVIEILPELASELYYPYAQQISQRLNERGIKVFTGVKDEEITDKGMVIIDENGKKVFLEADDIVICAGSVADKTLFESLKGKVPEVFEVGDCTKARRIYEAISEGSDAGLRV